MDGGMDGGEHEGTEGGEDARMDEGQDADVDGTYPVDMLKDLRYGPVAAGGFEVLVSWVGYPGEDTWEPLLGLYADVPVEVREFLHSYGELNLKGARGRSASALVNIH